MKHDILLKGTDLKVSPFAFGTVNAGLDYDGKDADDLLNYFVDNGGNLIDTARVYYDWAPGEIGRSERVIGDWLRRCGRRDEIVLMTKGGHPDKDSMDVSRMSQADMEYDINLSLNKLGIDTIDIYFYHRDDKNQSVAELIERMEGFRKKGMIRYYGCSNWTTERMKEADEYAKQHGYSGFIANQNLYNAGAKYMKPFPDKTMVTVDAEALDFYRNSNNTPMPYFGLCSGFFHNLKNKGEEAVKESPYYTPKNLEVAKKINDLCEKYNCTITQVLLAFYYYQDFPIIPLVGTVTIPQLEEALGSTNIEFCKEDFNF
ncbi:MAG: aldo/keto reductase [Erysipelotrichaceae bacterium]|nr:aldo/keto reductase [Erysipelotrichaceae bacterium]